MWGSLKGRTPFKTSFEGADTEGELKRGEASLKKKSFPPMQGIYIPIMERGTQGVR